jgi:hypothetical protein
LGPTSEKGEKRVHVIFAERRKNRAEEEKEEEEKGKSGNMRSKRRTATFARMKKMNSSPIQGESELSILGQRTIFTTLEGG